MNLVSGAPGGGQRGGCSWGAPRGGPAGGPLLEARAFMEAVSGGPLWEATSQTAMGALFVRSHGSYGSVPI